jgi:hypothetical protein
VAGSFEVDTTSQALSPADSLLVALLLNDSLSFGAVVLASPSDPCDAEFGSDTKAIEPRNYNVTC